MGSVVECIKRIYRIQTPNGVKMEVESEERSLSGVVTVKLLQEDKEVGSFFEKCKILNVNILRSEDRKSVPEKGSLLDQVRNVKKKLKKNKNIKNIDKNKNIKNIDKNKNIKNIDKNKKVSKETRSDIPNIKIEELKLDERLPPFERLNVLLKMEGEFTRPDYQKFMEYTTQRMSDYMGHEDIGTALLLKRIEMTGEKVEGFRKYRIIDTNPVDEDTYIKALREHKMKIKY